MQRLIAVASLVAVIIRSSGVAWTKTPVSPVEAAGLISDSGLNVPRATAFSPAKSAALVSDIGNVAKLKKDLDGGVGVDQPLSSGDTLLTDAAAAGNLGTVKFLLKSGAKINQRANRGWTALMAAIFYRHDAVAKYLLGAGASPSIVADGRVTAHKIAEWRGASDLLPQLPRVETTPAKPTAADLAHAVEAGYIASVQHILHSGVSPDSRDSNGDPVLFAAVVSGRPTLVQALLKGGAKADLRGKDGTTALMVAALFDRPLATALLLSHGADPTLATSAGVTALAIAERRKATDVTRILLAKLPKRSRHSLNAALVGAVQRGDGGAVNTLLKQGADPNGGTINGHLVRPLVIAAYKGEKGIVQALLKDGADVNKGDANRTTPLMAAIAAKDHKLAGFLVKLGAKSDQENNAGFSPASMARAIGWTSLGDVDLFSPSALRNAIDRGQIDQVREILAKPAGNELLNSFIASDDNYDYSPLDFAINNNNPAIVSLLLQLGADPNDDGGVVARAHKWPLLEAARIGSPAIIRSLLAFGSDPLVTTASGETPLTVSKSKGDNTDEHILQLAAERETRRRTAALVSLGYLSKIAMNWNRPQEIALKKAENNLPFFDWSGAPDSALKDALHATYRVCNEYTSDVFLATEIPANKIIEGWTKLKPKRCKWVDVDNAGDFDFNLLAERTFRGHRWAGKVGFCTKAAAMNNVPARKPRHGHCPGVWYSTMFKHITNDSPNPWIIK